MSYATCTLEFPWYFIQTLFIWRCCSEFLFWSRGEGSGAIVFLCSLDLKCITMQHYVTTHAYMHGCTYSSLCIILKSMTSTSHSAVHSSPCVCGTCWLSRQRTASPKLYVYVVCIKHTCISKCMSAACRNYVCMPKQ